MRLIPNGASSLGALQEDLAEERSGRLKYILFGLILTGGDHGTEGSPLDRP